MTKHMTTINRSNAYLGILTKLESEREAKEIANSLNPPVAATLCWDSKKGRLVYTTHYFGDVRITHRRARAAVMIEIGFKY